MTAVSTREPCGNTGPAGAFRVAR